jgi:hypothetical protein
MHRESKEARSIEQETGEIREETELKALLPNFCLSLASTSKVVGASSMRFD